MTYRTTRRFRAPQPAQLSRSIHALLIAGIAATPFPAAA